MGYQRRVHGVSPPVTRKSGVRFPAGEKFFFSPPFLDKWREIIGLICSPPLPLPPPIEKTLSFPPQFTAIHKWMPLCLKAWLSFSNKRTASAGNRTRAARALLQ